MGNVTQGVSIDPERPSVTDRLDSWKEIAEYLSRSVRSVRRWEAEEGLPVHRHLHQSSGTVYAFKTELDAWLLGRRPQLMSAAESPEAFASSELRADSAGRLRGRIFVAVAVVLIGLLASIGLWRFRSGTRAGSSAIHSLAVLPLENLTGNPAQAYFVDGMTDALITELAQLRSVSVISRTSSMQYKGANKRLADIAQELNVDGIVEGAASLTGSRVRVTAQLIHAATDRHVWARDYERDAEAVIELQAEIAHDIATAIENGGGARASPRAPRRQVVNTEAYDLFLKGLQAGGRVNYEGFRTAASYLEQAVNKQPDFAKAFAYLALVRLQFLYVGPMSPDEVLPPAEAAAHKALALDDTLPEPHRVVATIRRVYGDHAGADAETARALELAPSAGESQGLLATLLLRAGSFDEAVVAAKRARALDPLAVNRTELVARTLRAAGHDTRAIAELQNALGMAPDRSNVRFLLGATHVLQGNTKAAIPEFEKAVELSSQRNPRFRAYLGYAYGIDGRAPESRQLLQELLDLRERQYVSSFGIALIHDALGEKAAALTALERAFREHAVEFVLQDWYPPFKTLASEPRYRELMRRSGASR
jgi:TolB-like protein/Flp pilus assembly protein TadD